MTGFEATEMETLERPVVVIPAREALEAWAHRPPGKVAAREELVRS